MHHCARGHVTSGELQLFNCRFEDKVYDVLTKALPQAVSETWYGWTRDASVVTAVSRGML